MKKYLTYFCSSPKIFALNYLIEQRIKTLIQIIISSNLLSARNLSLRRIFLISLLIRIRLAKLTNSPKYLPSIQKTMKRFQNSPLVYIEYAHYFKQLGDTDQQLTQLLKAEKLYRKKPQPINISSLKELLEVLTTKGERTLAKKLIALYFETYTDPKVKIQLLTTAFSLDFNTLCQDLIETLKLKETKKHKSFELSIKNVVEIKDWCKNQEDAKYETLIKEQPFNTSKPTAFSYEHDNQIYASIVPEFFIAQLKNIDVFSRYHLFKDNELILYQKAAHPKSSFVADCSYYVTGNKKKPYQAFIHEEFKGYEEIENGFLLSGRCGKTYFHWLIEHITKLFAYEKKELYKQNIPLIVEENLPPQHLQALDIMNIHKAPLHFIGTHKKFHFKNLYLAPTPTFIPDNLETPFWLGAALSYPHLDFIRQRVLKQIDLSPQIESSTKIYLSRKNISRRGIINEHQVEKLFVKQGFKVINPEKLNFIEQVQVFSQARQIAGPSGSSLSNLIFCKPETKVFCIVGEAHKDFCLYSNLAKYAKLEFMHFAGQHPIKANFFRTQLQFNYSNIYIEPKLLQKAVQDFFELN